MYPDIISHYKLLEKIGEGGLGVVYKAEDMLLGHLVALKTLSVVLERDRAIEGFRRELRIISTVHHPNIITVYEVDEADGQPFLVMELLEGSTLSRRIGDKPLPLEEILDIGIQIADGLQAVHNAGIIHRDLKPSNIVLTRGGVVKIIDFGLATFVRRKPAINEGIVGSMAFMSPEQALELRVDSRSDLFSFGGILYNMATGQLPFQVKSPAALWHFDWDPPSAAEVNPELPPELGDIIRRAMARDPNSRYSTAASIRADLVHLKQLHSPTIVSRIYQQGRLADRAGVTGVWCAVRDFFWHFEMREYRTRQVVNAISFLAVLVYLMIADTLSKKVLFGAALLMVLLMFGIPAAEFALQKRASQRMTRAGHDD